MHPARARLPADVSSGRLLTESHRNSPATRCRVPICILSKGDLAVLMIEGSNAFAKECRNRATAGRFLARQCEQKSRLAVRIVEIVLQP